jgi:uncharacterized protein (DUF486 family)
MIANCDIANNLARRRGLWQDGAPDFEVPMSLPAPLVTFLLLVASNLFMTVAWYGHLRFKAAPMLLAILVSWGIAFFEYLLQVPANRIGYGALSAAQLKTMQEVISLSVFVVFNAFWLGEAITWRTAAGFCLIIAGAALIFSNRG